MNDTPSDRVDSGEELEELLQFLKSSRNFDFTGYKRTSLVRRIQKRMEPLGLKSYPEYQRYLEANPDEYIHLFNTILINLTAFFRDPGAWDYISEDIVPRIISSKDGEEPVRIWSAGCSSGEEAYTAAMVFAEHLGIPAFLNRVKLYATDIDDLAIGNARHGRYTARDVIPVPVDLLEKYFREANGHYVFHPDLRRNVIFGAHNLVADPPISKIDFLVCRNTLMYFTADAQRSILSNFHFSLNETGYLFLGKAEMLTGRSNLFVPIEVKRRLFRKLRKELDMRAIRPPLEPIEEEPVDSPDARLRELAFDANPIAEIVVDPFGTLVLANQRARKMFGLKRGDIGRPVQDLELSYRPLELRSVIEQAWRERKSVTLRDVEWFTDNGEGAALEVSVAPLIDSRGRPLSTSVTFNEVTKYKEAQEELEQLNHELQTVTEELQSANEELETTNEELQSTNEELETTNEELQSTNEELETMNEELQATNEELQTANEELVQRSDELDAANNLLVSVFSSLRGAVIVLDDDLRISMWSRGAEDMWGLRADEARAKSFLSLEIGMTVGLLKPLIRACLEGQHDDGGAELTVDATTRLGRNIVCKATCMPLLGATRPPRGVILLLEEVGPSDGRDATRRGEGKRARRGAQA